MKNIVNEFKEFISRGNVIDLAVGVIIGSAFGKIVSSLVDDIIMPLIGVILGGIDFSDLSIKVGSANIEVANNSMNSYKQADELATKLPCTNPIKLGLALNFSVFYYEVKNDPKMACKIANDAFDLAIHQLENIEDGEYKDSTTILQLLKENIDMWKSDIQEEGGEAEGEGEGEEGDE